jgi:hypothetical protein
VEDRQLVALNKPGALDALGWNAPSSFAEEGMPGSAQAEDRQFVALDKPGTLDALGWNAPSPLAGEGRGEGESKNMSEANS